MKIFIFTRNLKYNPSTYYRVTQYLSSLNVKYEVCEYESNLYYKIPMQVNKLFTLISRFLFIFISGYFRRIRFIIRILLEKESYKIFIQRTVFPRICGIVSSIILEKIISNAEEVIWDFDDNIFVSEEISKREKKILEAHVDKVISGNEYLLKYIDKKNKKIDVIRTTDELGKYFNNKLIKDRVQIYKQKITLVWVGTKTNIKFLEKIIPQLDIAAMNLNKEIILEVISNIKIKSKTKKLIIKNISWNREITKECLKKAHIGLMPLNNDEVTRGKCAFKAVQYISMGLPILVSDVGMNEKTISNNGYLIREDEEWSTKIIELATDIEKYISFSNNSRKKWIKDFDYKDNKQKIINIIKD